MEFESLEGQLASWHALRGSRLPFSAQQQSLYGVYGRGEEVDVPKVSSREYQQNLGYYLDLAIIEPVEITKRGRNHVVLLSAQEYKRLKRLDQQALFAWEVPEDVVAAIEKAEVPSDYEHLDAELES